MIFEVFDRRSNNPICVFIRSRDEDAIRSFEHLLSDPSDNVFTIAPEDFDLLAIDPYGDKLEQRVRIVKKGSEYSKLVLQQFRIERAKTDDELFRAIGEAYSKELTEKIKELTQKHDMLLESYDHLQSSHDDLIFERTRLIEENLKLKKELDDNEK